jgi:hypothetical protein
MDHLSHASSRPEYEDFLPLHRQGADSGPLLGSTLPSDVFYSGGEHEAVPVDLTAVAGDGGSGRLMMKMSFQSSHAANAEDRVSLRDSLAAKEEEQLQCVKTYADRYRAAGSSAAGSPRRRRLRASNASSSGSLAASSQGGRSRRRDDSVPGRLKWLHKQAEGFHRRAEKARLRLASLDDEYVALDDEVEMLRTTLRGLNHPDNRAHQNRRRSNGGRGGLGGMGGSMGSMGSSDGGFTPQPPRGGEGGGGAPRGQTLERLENKLEIQLTKLSEAEAANRAKRERINELRLEHLSKTEASDAVRHRLKSTQAALEEAEKTRRGVQYQYDQDRMAIAAAKMEMVVAVEDFGVAWSTKLAELVGERKGMHRVLEERHAASQVDGTRGGDGADGADGAGGKGGATPALERRPSIAGDGRGGGGGVGGVGGGGGGVTVKTYEQAFDRMQQATQMESLEEMVAIFLKSEERNFSL